MTNVGSWSDQFSKANSVTYELWGVYKWIDLTYSMLEIVGTQTVSEKLADGYKTHDMQKILEEVSNILLHVLFPEMFRKGKKWHV